MKGVNAWFEKIPMGAFELGLQVTVLWKVNGNFWL